MNPPEDEPGVVVALPIGARASRVTSGRDLIFAFQQDAENHLRSGALQLYTNWRYWRSDALESDDYRADEEADDFIRLLNRILPPDRWAGEHPLSPGVWGVWPSAMRPRPGARRWVRKD